METLGYTESVRTITGGVLRPGGFNITDRGIDLCNVSSQDRILDAECKDIPLIRGRLEALPFRNEIFEGIICECVLSHTVAALVLKEFSRVLKVDGYLILSELYRRRATGAPIPEVLTNMDLMEKDRIMEHLGSLHFRIIDWEDRSADLKKLAVNLIMSRGLSLMTCDRNGKTICADKILETWMGIGYYLLVAIRANI